MLCAGLVVDVPHQDTVVVAEGADYVDHIAAQHGIELGRIAAQTDSGVLDPAAIVHTRLGRRLTSVAGLSKPVVVEKYKEGLDAVALADIQEVFHVVFELRRTMLPDDAAQKYTQRIEAQLLGPTQLFVNLLGIIRGLAPHLYLVDSRSGNIVAPD